MKIAFHHMGSKEWTAGTTVLELLIHALRSIGSQRPEIALTVWENKAHSEYESLTNIVDSVIALPSQTQPRSTIQDVLTQNHVDCFFSLPIETAIHITTPRIVWIYDFQHVHIPANFAPEEIQRRTLLFSENIRTAQRILTYSESVAADIRALYPAQQGKLSVLPFIPHIPANAFTPAAPSSLYDLPPGFFLLANQFQPHKNHTLVVESLKLLREQNCLPHVVCTGYTETPVFQSTMALIQEYKLQSQWHGLGIVPRADFFTLLQKADAVLNPSTFEGFGLSAAEAVALGKRLLLSDIPIFHEQPANETLFFNPNDPVDLAKKMKTIWTAGNTPAPAGNTLAQSHKMRQKKFGTDLLHLAQAAINTHTPGENP